MVQDKSHDFVDTWDFLETRISDVKDLGKIYDDVSISSECINKILMLVIFHISLSASILTGADWKISKGCSSICLGWSEHCESELKIIVHIICAFCMHHGCLCLSLRLGICRAGISGVISSSRIDEPLVGRSTATRCILVAHVDDFKFYLYAVFEFVVIIIGNGRHYIRLADRLVKIATHK